MKWKTKKYLKQYEKDMAKQQALTNLMIANYPDSWEEVIWFKKIDGKTKIKRRAWPW